MNKLLHAEYKLSDRYEKQDGEIYITGTQALVRILLAQSARDKAAGLNTQGLVSGYRGSPLGAVDQELWRAGKTIEVHGIKFMPAINEDLAGTLVFGSQQVENEPNKKVSGVFAMWYGKGPGVDRAGDALKHGNAYGSSPHGGVLVVAGDDHGCVSSSMSHQSDLAFQAFRMPIIHPANIAEYEHFGLWGYAASRFSGCWVGFKAISETVEGTSIVSIKPTPAFNTPTDYTYPPTGVHYRWPDYPSPLIEQRVEEKLKALLAFARANPLDELVIAPKKLKTMIITTGKAHLDTLEALRVLGQTPQSLEKSGIGVYKIGLVFPLEEQALRKAMAGAQKIIVIEEKAPIIETQIKDILFNSNKIFVIGKKDEKGAPFIPADRELRPSLLSSLLIKALADHKLGLTLPKCWEDKALNADAAYVPAYNRTPYFCSGCPHNTSTKVPEGSRSLAGIGCHFMANWMDRETTGLVQMGAEGVDWTSLSKFTSTEHVFQNLGDGTYFHSGHMAIRQAIALGANITYKILYNDAVAMTGGQPVDGTLTVPQIATLVRAEGVQKIAIVTDEPEKYKEGYAPFPEGVSIHHRDDLMNVQEDMRQIKGVSVLIYDQTCASEKRKRRKKGQFPDPNKRIFINDLVCEGCGDCQKKSNCLSIIPLETELGRKRQIEQTSCNKDYSCIKGFCPSFVTVEGGSLRKSKSSVTISTTDVLAQAQKCPLPTTAFPTEQPFEVLVAGVGGTGIVTVGALMVMAANLEGKAASVLDFMGFAQKGGAVMSHVRMAMTPENLNQVRIDKGMADVVLAADLVVATTKDALSVLNPQKTTVLANTREIPFGAMLRDNKAKIETELLAQTIKTKLKTKHLESLNAQALAEALLGDAMPANILFMGYAWQMGLIPLSFEALMRAIEINGVAVDNNKLAFAYGRLAYADKSFIDQLLPKDEYRESQTLDEMLHYRINHLQGYQNKAYAQKYASVVEDFKSFEEKQFPANDLKLTKAITKYLFKLMAYKDEYEVARLYSGEHFKNTLNATFEGDFKLKFHLAPPLLSKTPKGQTEPAKIQLGSYMASVFGVLSKFKMLRGTPLDIFGYTHERKLERRLITDYKNLIQTLKSNLNAQNIEIALELLRLPDDIRGYGPVKERSIHSALAKQEILMKELLSATKTKEAA